MALAGAAFGSFANGNVQPQNFEWAKLFETAAGLGASRVPGLE